MSDPAGTERPERVPEAESPLARSEEQEVAGGRTASTPVAVLGSVVFLIACGVLVVLVLAGLAFYLA
jgi:hypothetical protein